jgi:CBS domain-containing protein
VKVKDAVSGPTVTPESLGAAESDEAVVLAVRGGEVAVVVRPGTPDDGAVQGASAICGTLRLENERVLTFQIRAGLSGGAFEDKSAEVHAAHVRHSSATVGRRAAGPSSTAGDIMTRDVVTASPDMLVEDIAKLLAFHNISGMPVEDWDGRVVGIVSEADVIGKIGDTIADVMTTEVISVDEATPIQQVAALMSERRIKRVPVMADASLLGIISRADIVRALAARP